MTRSATDTNTGNLPTPSYPTTEHDLTSPIPVPSLPIPPQSPPADGLTHKIFYQNQFSPAYKTDERIINNIIKNNVQCTNPAEKIKFIPYYRSNTITSLITKNNQGPPTPNLKKTSVIHQYQCPHGDCEHHPSTYIGLTTTTLSGRLTIHLASGGPKQHAQENYNLTITRNDLVSNTTIIYNQSKNNKLSIMEALLINIYNYPSTTSTGINRTLKLFT